MKRCGHAFTLIELLVVVAIIAILAALLLPALQGAKEQAKAAQCINNLRQITLSLIRYEEEYGHYLPAYGFADPNNPALGETFWPACLFRHYPSLLPNEAYYLYLYGVLDRPNGPATVWHCPSNKLRIHSSSTPYGGYSSPNYAINWFLGLQSPLFYPSNRWFYATSADLKAPARTVMVGESKFRLSAGAAGQPCEVGWYTIEGGIGNQGANMDVHRGRGNIGFVDGHIESGTESQVLQKEQSLDWLVKGPNNVVVFGNPWTQ